MLRKLGMGTAAALQQAHQLASTRLGYSRPCSLEYYETAINALVTACCISGGFRRLHHGKELVMSKIGLTGR